MAATLVTVLAAYALWFGGRSSRDAGSKIPPEIERRIAALSRDLDATRADLAATRRAQNLHVHQFDPVPSKAPAQGNAPSESAAKDQAGSQTEQPHARPSFPEQLERERQQFHEYFGSLEDIRKAEPEDVQWGRQVQAQIDEVMKAPALSGSHIQSIQCRRTLCRIEAEHQNEIARLTFIQRFINGVGAVLPEASVYSPYGSHNSTGYFAREGTSLPGITEVGPEHPGAE